MDYKMITGKSKFFTLIGDPISHVRAQEHANKNLDLRGLFGEYLMLPIHVSAEDLKRAWEGLKAMKNFGGSIVTMPHKAAIIPLLEETSPVVKLAGACNVVRKTADGRFYGENLDGEGFVAGLKAAGFDVAGKSVYLAGAGGVASASAFALAKYGAAVLTIVNRSADKAEDLASRVKAAFPKTDVRLGLGAEKRFDLVVNGTPVGMKDGDPASIPEEIVRKASYVADCIAGREDTEILKLARTAGLPWQNGIPMIVAQSNIILDMFGAKK